MVNSIKYDEIIGYKKGSNERNISFGNGNVQDAYNTNHVLICLTIDFVKLSGEARGCRSVALNFDYIVFS